MDTNPDIELIIAMAERLGYIGLAQHIRMAPPCLKIAPSPLSKSTRTAVNGTSASPMMVGKSKNAFAAKFDALLKKPKSRP